MSTKYPIVGILGIQGDFAQHSFILNKIGYCKIIDVRNEISLNKCDGLIIPGGESTSIGIILKDYKLLNSLKKFILNPKKIIWGICAGLIILSDQINNSQLLHIYNNKTSKEDYSIQQPLIGGLNITTHRNYFGSQVDSALRTIYIKNNNGNIIESQSHFIRAPVIIKINDNLNINEICYCYDDNNNKIIAGVYNNKNNIMGTIFHPEITYNNDNIYDLYWHQLFLKKINNNLPINYQPIKPFKNGNCHKGLWSVKIGMPRMLCGGVIMDVVNETQAKIAEEAGACSVMALERIPADIKKDGGIARMTDPILIKKIKKSVSIPIMAKSRIGHFGESKILQSLNIDCIDESEVLTPADETYHINKHKFNIPFVCGAKNLGEALRRISEGAAMIRLKGNAGTGNVMHAVRHARLVFGEINKIKSMNNDELFNYSKDIQAPYNLVKLTAKLGRLPVTTFAAGGISTPADVMMMMELGVDGVFVGSGIFKSDNPTKRARAIVHACTYYKNANIVSKVSENLGKAMVGILDNGEKYRFIHKDSKL